MDIIENIANKRFRIQYLLIQSLMENSNCSRVSQASDPEPQERQQLFLSLTDVSLQCRLSMGSDWDSPDTWTYSGFPFRGGVYSVADSDSGLPSPKIANTQTHDIKLLFPALHL